MGSLTACASTELRFSCAFSTGCRRLLACCPDGQNSNLHERFVLKSNLLDCKYMTNVHISRALIQSSPLADGCQPFSTPVASSRGAVEPRHSRELDRYAHTPKKRQDAATLPVRELRISELRIRAQLARPPVQNSGPLNVVILVPNEAIARAGIPLTDRRLREDFKKEMAANMIKPWREEMRRVAPNLKVRVKYHFGYKGYFPRGTEEQSAAANDFSSGMISSRPDRTYDARAKAQSHRAFEDVANFLLKKETDRPGRYSITSRNKYLIAVPKEINLYREGAAIAAGSAGYFSIGNPHTFGHEVGHMLDATHRDAGYGIFNWGGTYMSGSSGLFLKTKYSEKNTENIREYLGLDRRDGKCMPRFIETAGI
jgi:hypothetical protein